MEANRWEWDRGLVEVGGRVDRMVRSEDGRHVS